MHAPFRQLILLSLIIHWVVWIVRKNANVVWLSHMPNESSKKLLVELWIRLRGGVSFGGTQGTLLLFSFFFLLSVLLFSFVRASTRKSWNLAGRTTAQRRRAHFLSLLTYLQERCMIFPAQKHFIQDSKCNKNGPFKIQLLFFQNVEC